MTPPVPPPPPPPSPSFWRDHKVPNWLSGVFALVAAGAVIAAALIARDDGDDQIESPEIAITNPASLHTSGEELILSGHVANLGPGQTVWAFNRLDISTQVYPRNGPCPVDEKGDWTCPAYSIGQASEVGHEFEIYAMVVDDSDVPELIDNAIDRSDGIYLPSDESTSLRGVAVDSIIVIKD